MRTFKTGDLVYITTTKAIGFIINQGVDVCPWYRTDADGIREAHELEPITSPDGVLNLIMQDGDTCIAPSLKKPINKYFGVEIFDEKLLQA